MPLVATAAVVGAVAAALALPPWIKRARAGWRPRPRCVNLARDEVFIVAVDIAPSIGLWLNAMPVQGLKNYYGALNGHATALHVSQEPDT